MNVVLVREGTRRSGPSVILPGRGCSEGTVFLITDLHSCIREACYA